MRSLDPSASAAAPTGAADRWRVCARERRLCARAGRCLERHRCCALATAAMPPGVRPHERPAGVATEAAGHEAPRPRAPLPCSPTGRVLPRTGSNPCHCGNRSPGLRRARPSRRAARLRAAAAGDRARAGRRDPRARRAHRRALRWAPARRARPSRAHRGDPLGAARARRRRSSGSPRRPSRSAGSRVLLHPAHALLAAERSAQLRGLLEELRREHSCNRALMQIELSFLDHLMQSLALDAGVHGYDPRGSTTSSASAARHGALRVLDLQA